MSSLLIRICTSYTSLDTIQQTYLSVMTLSITISFILICLFMTAFVYTATCMFIVSRWGRGFFTMITVGVVIEERLWMWAILSCPCSSVRWSWICLLFWRRMMRRMICCWWIGSLLIKSCCTIRFGCFIWTPSHSFIIITLSPNANYCIDA